MKKITYFLLVFAALITFYILSFSLTLNTSVQAQTAEPTATPPPALWTYEGAEGPEAWGTLDERYVACAAGHAQSPIDIAAPQGVDLQPITFTYEVAPLAIFNNGHTIEVEYHEGSSIIYNEIQYNLAQFHFHHPSEHTVNGESFDMELHFVHRSASGNLAVVGVLLRVGDNPNPAFAAIFDNLPAEVSEPDEEAETTINALDLLPESKLYDTYTGSLTTPPCSEGVRWLVLTEPVEISAEQAAAFGAIFELNARPVQPLNARDLLEDNAG